MRWRLALGLFCLASSTAQAADPLSVPLNESTRLTVRGPANSIFIGNPNVVDVIVVDRRSLILTGKSQGTSNLVILDSRGRTLLDTAVQVSLADNGRVSLHQGSAPATEYVCLPHCQREIAASEAPTGNKAANDVAASLKSLVSGKP